ncbi:MAG: response regulator [Nitrospirae bacterium]|nr:response regulator [Nitrospirota bacterium]
MSEKKNKILYLEDELGMKHTLIRALEDKGYEVRIVPNVVDAYSILIEKENSKGFDLLIMDIYMDAMHLGKKYKLYEDRGGLCILKELIEKNVNIGVIIFSNYDDKDVREITRARHIPYILKSEASDEDGFYGLIDLVKKTLPIKITT